MSVRGHVSNLKAAGSSTPIKGPSMRGIFRYAICGNGWGGVEGRLYLAGVWIADLDLDSAKSLKKSALTSIGFENRNWFI